MAWTVKRCSDSFLAPVATSIAPDLERRELSFLCRYTSYTQHLSLTFICGSWCASTALQRGLRVYTEVDENCQALILLISGLPRLNVGPRFGRAFTSGPVSPALIFVFKIPILGKFLHCWAWGAFLHCWPSVLMRSGGNVFIKAWYKLFFLKEWGKLVLSS